jgi:hypothetical protein
MEASGKWTVRILVNYPEIYLAKWTAALEIIKKASNRSENQQDPDERTPGPGKWHVICPGQVNYSNGETGVRDWIRLAVFCSVPVENAKDRAQASCDRSQAGAQVMRASPIGTPLVAICPTRLILQLNLADQIFILLFLVKEIDLKIGIHRSLLFVPTGSMATA